MTFQDRRKYITTRITEWLTTYATNIKTNSAINDQSGAVYAENNIRDLLNFLLSLTLVNGNKASQNMKGIDLIDTANKYCVQITVTKTSKKIKESLKKTKDLLGDTTGWQFKMMILSMADEDIKKLKKDTALTNPALSFDPSKDIWDLTWIKKQIDDLDIDQLENAYALCEKMFGKTAFPAPEVPSVQYLTAIPPQTTLYGRAQELEDLENAIAENQRLVLVNGIGGIGKSALARKLFSQMRNNYDRIGWIPYKDKLKDSLIASITLPALQTIDQPEARFSMIYQELLKNKKTLLFIDDVTHDSSEDEVLDQIAGLDHLSLVLTSRRESVEKFDPFPVDSIKPEDCFDLFYGYYGKPKKDQDLPIVKQLVEWAYYHTLTIELLAKAAKRESSLSTYFAKLQENGFAAPRLKVNSKTVEEHIQMLYRMADFEEGSEPYRILWNLALMPTMDIPTEVEEWISADVNDFEELIQRGWITYHEDENASGYYMHALIKKIILYNGEVPKNIADALLIYVSDGKFFSPMQIYREKQVRLELLEEVMKYISIYDSHLYSNFSVKVINAAMDVGDYQREEELLKKIDASSQDLGLEKKYQDTDEKNIAQLHVFLKKSEQEHDLDSLQTAKLHKGLADLYLKTKMYSEAKNHYLNGLTTYEREYGMTHSETVSIYENLAFIYSILKNYLERNPISLKLLQAYKLLYGSDHPKTARVYEYLAEEYMEMERYVEAEKWCIKAIPIRERYNGPTQVDCQLDYLWLREIYQKLEQPEKEVEYLLKAYCSHVKRMDTIWKGGLARLCKIYDKDLKSTIELIRAYDEQAYTFTKAWLESLSEK